MCVLFAGALALTYGAEIGGNPLLASLPVDQAAGNMEGKEVRFGVGNSALWATATTAASNGSVNAMHDSFTPLGALAPMLQMQIGEIIFGGVGSGFYGMLLFVVLTVFLAGLMVGRTPEYLGKKIEAKEVKLAILAFLVMPVGILGLRRRSPSCCRCRSPSLQDAGPHGLSEILYAYSSATGNNGSAFAGFGANTPYPQHHARHRHAARALRLHRADAGDRRRRWRPRRSCRPRPAPSRPIRRCSSRS